MRALPTGADADFNHFYRSEQAVEGPACEGPHCAALELIGWTRVPDPAPACAEDVAVGVIDTGINPDHLTFSTARLEVRRIAPEALDPSRAVHGTAVLALLVGDPASRSPGLLPDTRVIAVDAFHRAGGDERADVYSLAAALDYLAGQGVRVVNMSLAGPDNSVLERATAAMLARDIVIVAAVGNAGPSAPPAFPAAYPEVIGVTAVDRSGTVYRRAGRGPHVDLAAPGVEVWTAASVSGARPKTGTSFAAPFVTAAAAALRAAEPALTREQVAAALTGAARDVGPPGPDEIYGHGLVQATRACRPPPA
ncbi:MAG: S8 family serine peptidase [Rhodobacteraceae bacterium]|nr:S8 family serine peptidase [Paracoccaceae bacterium]